MSTGWASRAGSGASSGGRRRRRSAPSDPIPTGRNERGLHENRSHLLGWTAALAIALGAGTLRAQDQDPTRTATPTATRPPPGRRRRPGHRRLRTTRSSATSTRSSRVPQQIDGLFTLHHKDDHLYAEIKPHQLDQPFLRRSRSRRGMAMAGQPAELRRRVGAGLPAGRRQGPAHPPQHPLQGPRGDAAGEGGQAELHRLDPDGPADRQRSTTATARAS